jgi:hypothetical protein
MNMRITDIYIIILNLFKHAGKPKWLTDLVFGKINLKQTGCRDPRFPEDNQSIDFSISCDQSRVQDAKVFTQAYLFWIIIETYLVLMKPASLFKLNFVSSYFLDKH